MSRTISAVVYDDNAGTVDVQSVDLAEPGPGEVRVRIAAAGVCHSDLHVRRGEWTAPSPMVMGHEGSGIVTAVGAGVVSPEVGDHVVLSWVAPCGTCRHCRAGYPARCEIAATMVAPRGVLWDGTSRLSSGGGALHHYLGVSSFADEAVVVASAAVPVRKDAPLDTLAVVGCAVATGIGAVLNTARVPAGATAVVIGCGGVGLNIVQGCRLAGAARIIAVDVRSDKTQAAIAFGATDALTVDQGRDAVTAVRELIPDGADFVFDAIGKTATTEQAVRMLALGGAAVIVGLPPSGATASFEPLVLAESEQRILGCNYGSITTSVDIPRFVDMYMEGELMLDELITARRPLHDASAALDELDAGGALRTLLVPGWEI
jgi:S-(hydroxymethyl)glutathione dehydrogenase / alcohol dehydrogenase